MIRDDPDDLGRGIAETIEDDHLGRLHREPERARRTHVAPAERRGRGLDLGVGCRGPTGSCPRLQSDRSCCHRSHRALVGLLLDEHLDRRRCGTRGHDLALDLGRELTSELRIELVDGALTLGPNQRQRVADRRDDLGTIGHDALEAHHLCDVPPETSRAAADGDDHLRLDATRRHHCGHQLAHRLAARPEHPACELVAGEADMAACDVERELRRRGIGPAVVVGFRDRERVRGARDRDGDARAVGELEHEVVVGVAGAGDDRDRLCTVEQ